ncbi:unnamed protein product [Brassica oleracea]
MDASGQFRQYNMQAKMVMWYLPWAAPKERCDGYGYCGVWNLQRQFARSLLLKMCFSSQNGFE